MSSPSNSATAIQPPAARRPTPGWNPYITRRDQKRVQDTLRCTADEALRRLRRSGFNVGLAVTNAASFDSFKNRWETSQVVTLSDFLCYFKSLKIVNTNYNTEYKYVFKLLKSPQNILNQLLAITDDTAHWKTVHVSRKDGLERLAFLFGKQGVVEYTKLDEDKTCCTIYTINGQLLLDSVKFYFKSVSSGWESISQCGEYTPQYFESKSFNKFTTSLNQTKIGRSTPVEKQGILAWLQQHCCLPAQLFGFGEEVPTAPKRTAARRTFTDVCCTIEATKSKRPKSNSVTVDHANAGAVPLLTQVSKPAQEGKGKSSVAVDHANAGAVSLSAQVSQPAQEGKDKSSVAVDHANGTVPSSTHASKPAQQGKDKPSRVKRVIDRGSDSDDTSESESETIRVPSKLKKFLGSFDVKKAFDVKKNQPPVSDSE